MSLSRTRFPSKPVISSVTPRQVRGWPRRQPNPSSTVLPSSFSVNTAEKVPLASIRVGITSRFRKRTGSFRPAVAVFTLFSAETPAKSGSGSALRLTRSKLSTLRPGSGFVTAVT